MSLHAFIFAKNEEANIERSVSALRGEGVGVTVLDSGSTDRTLALAQSHGAQVEAFAYVDHLTSYRQICVKRIGVGEVGLILDADMVVSAALIGEVHQLAADPSTNVISAPIAMWWNGVPLARGSLYPPKPFAFRGGREYFEAVGHGEQLKPEIPVRLTRSALIHDDRKPYEVFLTSQARYSSKLVERARGGSLTWRDRIRFFTPAMTMVTPLVSYLLKGGILSGRAGLLYALDRLIAETIMFREGVASRMHRRGKEEPPDSGPRS